MMVFLAIIISFAAGILFFASFEMSEDYGSKIFLCPIFLGILAYCLWTSQVLKAEIQETNAKNEQYRIERTKPYLISKMDNGCEVYEFFGYRDDSIHHFVRCPNASTDSSDTLQIGKTKRSDDTSTQ